MVAYADSARKEPLEEMPGTLAGKLASAPQRVVVAHADSIRIERVSYPRDLINDQQAPKISDVGTGQLPDGRFAVFWTTDQFADSKVELGTTSGNYTNIVSDALYVKTHVVPLTGLTIGGKYCFRSTSADLNGNKISSEEYSFIYTEKSYLYLPIVLRRFSFTDKQHCRKVYKTRRLINFKA